MGSRKRSRPNPKVDVKPKAIETVNEATSSNSSPRNASGHEDAITTSSKVSESDAISVSQSQKSRSWYAGGTWPRIQKSTPSIKVARETILADKNSNSVSADFSRFEPRRPDVGLSSSSALRPPSMSLGKGKETLDMTLPAAQMPADDKPNSTTDGEQSTSVENSKPDTLEQHISTADDVTRPAPSSGWMGWLGMAKTEKLTHSELPGTLSLPNSDTAMEFSSADTIGKELSVQDAEHQGMVDPSSGTSWFGFWPASTQDKAANEVKLVETVPQIDHPDESSADVQPTLSVTSPALGSTWAFWSKESRKSGQMGTATDEVGALAITGESSQDKPVPAHTSASEEAAKVEAVKQRKRGRPQSVIEEAAQKLPQTNTDSKKVTTSQSPTPSKSLPINLLLPSFHDTYHLMENPSIIQQIARLIMHDRDSPTGHVHLLREPPKMKKALAIGIHGLFPAALLRTVIGQPTGTSIRFANHASAAIHRWTKQHGYGEGDVEVEKISLEGEGKIAERVDNLWKLLLNWIDHVRTADFILVACHSQGVPVAVMLVAKLIEFGVITSARVGICAMAGVSLGPFADYKSRLFSGSAAELFDFANPESEVSKRYEDSLRATLNYGARISYVGSIDDQLVSLESAIFAAAHHPYIYRSVFVDGRVHAPDFIAHLVGFALKLRNLGVSDHGLIRELSVPLAGSLYTGEGHSRLYDEAAIYDVAIQFALETSSVGKVPLRLQKYEVPNNANPFQLPWSMRGLLEEDIIKTELNHETKDLLQQFEDWKPSTKVLKDVKYRLEAIKSKL